MVIIDQGIEAEAAKLGVPVINQDEFNAGILNGTQAATFAHKLTGKTEGMIGIGNGNPGLDLDRQASERQRTGHPGVQQGERHRLHLRGKFADDEFFDPDRVDPEVERQDRRVWRQPGRRDRHRQSGSRSSRRSRSAASKPGQIAVGSTDMPPAYLRPIEQGWVQWGIDQQFYVDGLLRDGGGLGSCSSAAIPTKTIRTGGEVVTDGRSRRRQGAHRQVGRRSQSNPAISK